VSGAALAERRRQPGLFDAPAGACQRPAAPGEGRAAAGEPTLDERLASLWPQLSGGRAVACPLCGGLLEPRGAAAAGHPGGRCRDCGTALD
jgi:hypothetical protein